MFSLTSPEVWSPIEATTAITKGFNGNVSVYSIVMKDAKKFGSIPIFVYDATKKEEKAGRQIKAMKKIEDAKGSAGLLNELINRPNKNEGQDAFLSRVRAYYKICGEAFIWLNRGDTSGYLLPDGSADDMAIDRLPVIEMQVLPSNLITIIPDPFDLWGVLGYVLEAGERIVIRKNDVVHWKNVNMGFDVGSRGHTRGMSPLVPGSKTLEESNSLSLASMRAAQNDGAKAVIYNESLNSMSPTQQTDLRRVIDAKLNNNDVSGAVASLQGKWGLLNLSMSSKEQMQLEKKEMSWQELCFLFDVPVEFFNPDVTHANKEQALLGWVTNDIIPACKQFNGELNRTLLKAFNLEGVALIAADYSELPEVQKGMVEAAKVMQEIWSIAPDEVREMLGFEPLGGDFAEPWVTAGRTPLSQMNDIDPDELVNQAYGQDTGGSNANVPKGPR